MYSLFRDRKSAYIVSVCGNPEQEVLVSMRASDHPPVIILGRQAELIDAFVTAFDEDGVVALHGDTAVEQADDAADSIVLILDETRADSMFSGHRLAVSKRRARLHQNDICDSTIAVALRTGPRRLLVVCDARHLSFGQRVRVVSWIRQLLHRVGYECAINGLQNLVTRYALIDHADEVPRTAARAVEWHRGHPADGPAPQVPLSPCGP